VWQGFGTGGGYRGGFCERLTEASPCPIELVPASSMTDPPLAKAQPISDGGSASMGTYSKREGEKKKKKIKKTPHKGVCSRREE